VQAKSTVDRRITGIVRLLVIMAAAWALAPFLISGFAEHSHTDMHRYPFSVQF